MGFRNSGDEPHSEKKDLSGLIRPAMRRLKLQDVVKIGDLSHKRKGTNGSPFNAEQNEGTSHRS
jgi:hypothetical protein